jgi:hypothetical protein
MKTLLLTLQDDIDISLLPVLAKFWKVNIVGLDRASQIMRLRDAMLNPEQTESAWDSLDDRQRGALQMLIGSGGKMPMAKFARLFGEVRQMGAAQIERENPLQKPANVAEALFYRGLVAQAFEMAEAGPRLVVYVPADLARALPTKKTSYPGFSTIDPKDAEAFAAAEAAAATQGTPLPPDLDEPLIEPLMEVTGIKQADTSIVDDLTTVLAYLQLVTPLLDEDTLAEQDRDQLKPHLLKFDDDRLSFLFALGLSANLIEIINGKAYPRRVEARQWMEARRSEQIRTLVEHWRASPTYRELWHVPGLYPDPGGELDQYDAAAVRGVIVELLEMVPRSDWWALDQFINAVKETDADFQRPNGDYESWYIRDERGDYLTGFDNWESVEGALLEFVITGPMHWLGLTDRADDCARLTAYGRALLAGTAWPAPAEPDDKLTLREDGTLLISRKVSRVDRFQAARFTSWIAAGDPYTYRLDSAGVQQAAEQGINTGHILSFLGRLLGDAPIPPTIMRLLDNWRGGPTASVTVEELTVLRTTAPETMERILDAPALRRYLGARLGPMAVIVRAGQWDALQAALGEVGIQAERV